MRAVDHPANPSQQNVLLRARKTCRGGRPLSLRHVRNPGTGLTTCPSVTVLALDEALTVAGVAAEETGRRNHCVWCR